MGSAVLDEIPFPFDEKLFDNLFDGFNQITLQSRFLDSANTLFSYLKSMFTIFVYFTS